MNGDDTVFNDTQSTKSTATNSSHTPKKKEKDQ